MNPILVIVKGKSSGESYAIDEEILSLGSDPDCDICIRSAGVSRTHCRIFACENEYLIKDSGSQQGTRVNNELIDIVRLSDGDMIQLGDVALRFEIRQPVEVIEYVEINAVDKTLRLNSKLSMVDGEFSNQTVPLSEADLRQAAPLQRDLQFFYEATLAADRSQSNHDVFKKLLELTLGWLDLRQGLVFETSDDSQELVHHVATQGPEGQPPFPPPFSARLVRQVRQTQQTVVSQLKVSARDQGEETTELHALCIPIASMSSMSAVMYLDTYGCSSHPGFSIEQIKILYAIAVSTANAIQNRKAIRANVARDRFAAVGEVTSSISHRVNNILQVINGGVYLVDYGLQNDDSELVSKGWSIVKRNQSRITRMTTNLLAYSRKFDPSLSNQSLPKLIEEALEALSETDDVSRIEIRHQNVDNLTAYVDRFYSIKIIENLLSLALAASMEEGKVLPVSLVTSVERNYSTLAITFRHLDDRFDVTRMIDRPVDRLKVEMGVLELAVSKNMVEGQNGELTVSSEPNNLNVIKVKFPRGTNHAHENEMVTSGGIK